MPYYRAATPAFAGKIAENEFLRQLRAGQGGFSLIEIIIVVVVLGVLSAGVAVSWVSFMRHQELRQEALGIQKDIMAQRARVLAGGTGSSVEFKFIANGYEVHSSIPDDDGNPPANPHVRTVALNSRISIDTAGVTLTPLGDLPNFAGAANGWSGGILIRQLPGNLAGDVYEEGWIVLRSSAANRQYCVMMHKTSIKPEIYTRTGSGPWKRI